MADRASHDLEQRLTERVSDAVGDSAEAQSAPVNVYETTGALVVVCPLPGVMDDDIEVEVRGRQVIIRAAMRTAAPKDYLVHEWTYGPYERSLEVPDGFGGEAAASFGNGQLALRLGRGPSEAGQVRTVVPGA